MSAAHATPAVEQTNGASVPAAVQNAADLVAEKSTAAFNAVANHPAVQDTYNSVANGPVAQNAKAEAQKTSSEFSNLSASRTTPSTKTATGQNLTHYHSFFSSLLSWENPRASGIAYISIVLFIFGARYLNLLRLMFKATWMTLGITVAAEVAGQALFSSGFTSQFRPSKYYIIPKETLEAAIGDVHELINFFVIEFQRILFAENIYASGAAFIAAFISYYLIKIVPVWGLSLIGTSTVFLGPLIYKSNKEFIDHHLSNASQVISEQSEQVKNIASQHTSSAIETTKQYVGDYSAKAQETIQTYTGRSSSPSAVKTPQKPSEPTMNAGTTKAAPLGNTTTSTSTFKSEDFPAAPTNPFVKSDPASAEFVTAPIVVTDEKPLYA